MHKCVIIEVHEQVFKGFGGAREVMLFQLIFLFLMLCDSQLNS